MLLRLVFVWPLATQAACRTVPATEVLVSICWDSEVGERLTHLEVRRADAPASEPLDTLALSERVAAQGSEQAQSFSIVPARRGQREFGLVITGTDHGRRVIEYRADGTFVPEEARQLDIYLRGSCLERCLQQANQTCQDGRCVDVESHTSLPAVASSARCPTTPPSHDSGVPDRRPQPHPGVVSDGSAWDSAVQDAGPSHDASSLSKPPPGVTREMSPDASHEPSGASQDECDQACSPGRCTRLPDDEFECWCPRGYSSSGGGCEDIDECEIDPPQCPSPQRCVDAIGGGECSCTGYYAEHPSDPHRCSDPHFVDVHLLSSSATDNWLDVATDGTDVLLAGHCDAPCRIDGFTHAAFGGEDVVLARLDESGHRLWSTTVGGPGNDLGYAVDALPDGGLVAGGQAELEGVDLGFGPLGSAGDRDGWAVGFDAAGDPRWQFIVASPGFDTVRGLAAGADGRTVIVGRHSGPLVFGELSLPHAGGEDLFVIALDRQGRPEWVRGFGGPGDDGAEEIAIDARGDIYVAGYFSGSISLDGSVVDSPGRGGLLLKLYHEEGHLAWFDYIAAGDGKYQAVAVDPASDHLYAGGYFDGSTNIGADSYASDGPSDGFLAKYDLDGRYLWSMTYGAGSWDATYAIAIEADGELYIAGSMRGATMVGDTLLPGHGAVDAMFAKLAPDGQVLWAHNFGGPQPDWARALAIDADGDILMCGRVDDPASLLSGEARVVPAGNDGYLLRLRP